MKKKLAAKLLAVCLASTMVFGLAGCQSNAVEKGSESASAATSESKEVVESTPSEEVSSGPIEVTYPVDTDVKISFWGGDGFKLYSGYTTAEESPVHMGLIEKTGIDIEWQFVPKGGNKDQLYNLIWAEAKQPTVIWNWYPDNAETIQLEADGLIYDLTDYVEEYAPDFWEYMNRPENDFLLKSLTTDDGRILRIPQVQEGQYNQTFSGFAIRQDWLDECGLKAPVTIADWEKVLAAFKEKYNAGIVCTIGQASSNGFIASGFDALGFMPERLTVNNDKVNYAVAEDEYKAMMETIVKWIENGWIDKDLLTMDLAGVRAKALSGEAGIVVARQSDMTNIIKDAENENYNSNWVALSYPRVSEGHPTSMVMTSSSRMPGYGAVITKSASEEEMKAALQLLNYAFTEEGMMYLNFGEEGVSYEIGADGKPQLTAAVTEDELGTAEALKKYSFHGASCFGIQMSDLVRVKNLPIVAAAPDVWAENTVADEHFMPAVSLTEEENEVATDLRVAIDTYMREETAKFLSGERSMSEWDKFVEELYDMDLQDYIDVYQVAYDRFCAK